jgi:flagellar biosynthesis protein FliP
MDGDARNAPGTDRPTVLTRRTGRVTGPEKGSIVSVRCVPAARRLAIVVAVVGLILAAAPAALAQVPPDVAPVAPQPSIDRPDGVGAVQGQPGGASISLDLGEEGGDASQSLLIIILLTLLAVAPALLVMLTSFTRIVIVLSLTRNALGLQGIPPNQVLVGLALFLSMFVMGPTLSEINEEALQPMLAGDMDQADAYETAMAPLRTFMMSQVRPDELAMFASAGGAARPATPADVSIGALIPAFILSELKTAFIIGFIVFIPFLVIDMVVSSSLMSMGMMMLPPILVSLPFKLLLFVMVDGWALVVRSLISSFN